MIDAGKELKKRLDSEMLEHLCGADSSGSEVQDKVKKKPAGVKKSMKAPAASAKSTSTKKKSCAKAS